MIERPKSVGQAWRIILQQQKKIERLEAALEVCEVPVKRQRKEIERLRERCRIQDKLISDNADLHDTIERLESINAIRKIEIKQLRMKHE